MREIRIYTPQALATGSTLWLPPDPSHHLAAVLRVKPGQRVVLFNGRGGEFEATIETADRKSCGAAVGAFRDVARESRLSITLAQAVSKGERMDFVVQKATELGVAEIAPILTARGNVRLSGERWEKRQAHWQAIAIAAAEQSGRVTVPAVRAPAAFGDWLHSRVNGLRLVLAPGAGQGISRLDPPRDGAATLLIGPEGGFDDAELHAAQAAGFILIRLGPRMLRTETAAVAALACLQARWGDLG